MPRKRKTQAPKAAASQAYGVRGDQMAAQAQMPLPAPPTAAEVVATPPAASPQPTGMFGPDGAPSPDLLAAAQASPTPDLPLTAPTQMSGQPITAGMSRGPGPGPEVLRTIKRPSPLADNLQRIARRTGNRDLADIAERLRAQGVK